MTIEPTAADRTLDAFRRLVRTVFPALRYFGRYRYAVHSATVATFDGTPVDATVAPALPTGVPYAPSLAGSSCIPTQGTIAHVMFADGDPGQPVCVGFEGGGASTVTAIDAASVVLAGGGKAVARVDDFVCRLYFTGTELYVSFSPSAPYAWTLVGPPLGPPIPPLPTDAGTAIDITTGSTKTSSG